MLIFVGDVHAEFVHFRKHLLKMPKDAIIIQIGDFGIWPYYQSDWEKNWIKVKRNDPIYFIDGNHEYHPFFEGITTPTEIWNGLIFIPRGTVLELDGKTIGFLGGGTSVDKDYRTPGHDWFPEECVTDAQADLLLSNAAGKKIDILATHVPPASTILANFDQNNLRRWGIDPSWMDPSAIAVQRVWNELDNPELFCGHLHRSVVHRNVRILDILECYPYRAYE